MKYSFSLILLFIINACTGSEKHLEKQLENNKIISVSFKIDNKNIMIKDDFEILFIEKQDTIKSIIRENEILFPNLKHNKEYDIVFIYEKYKLSFSKITYNMIFPNQNFELAFGIEYPPFTYSKDILTTEEYENRNQYNEIQYLQFNLFEYGDGIQFINKM